MNKMPQTPAVHISQLTRFNLEKGIGLGVRSSESGRLRSDAQSVDVTTGVFAVHQCAADQLGCADDRLAKTVLDSEQLTYVEAEIVQAKLPHRPGEVARAASRLGEANININYAYCGLEPGTNTPLVFFGVAEVDNAAPILEQAAAAAKP